MLRSDGMVLKINQSVLNISVPVLSIKNKKTVQKINKFYVKQVKKQINMPEAITRDFKIPDDTMIQDARVKRAAFEEDKPDFVLYDPDFGDPFSANFMRILMQPKLPMMTKQLPISKCSLPIRCLMKCKKAATITRMPSLL
ncbi:MAG: hypothetical protein ABI855_12830 [Bacteroidota bacterium]